LAYSFIAHIETGSRREPRTGESNRSIVTYSQHCHRNVVNIGDKRLISLVMRTSCVCVDSCIYMMYMTVVTECVQY